MADITYNKPYPGGWDDFPLTDTPITGSALNAMDAGITAATAQANTALDTATARAKIAADIGGTADAPQVTGTHLASPLPVSQGGTGKSSALTASDVGADAAGAAAAAQSAAEAASVPLAGGAMGGHLAPKVTTLTDAATIAVDASLGNDFRVALGGNRTMGAPSNPVDGQQIMFELIQDATGSRTVTWASGAGGYAFGSAGSPTLSTAANATDLAGFRYSSAKSAWLYLGMLAGF